VSCGKVLAPVASEDLLALANQGVMPEGLGLEFVAEADECNDSVPVAGTSNSDVAWAIQQQSLRGPLPQEVDLCRKPRNQDAVTKVAVSDQKSKI